MTVKGEYIVREFTPRDTFVCEYEVWFDIDDVFNELDRRYIASYLEKKAAMRVAKELNLNLKWEY